MKLKNFVSKIGVIALLGFGWELIATKEAAAVPVQCYIGKDGAYQVCDLSQVGPVEYLLTWPDGERTAIVETSTPSGSWLDVRHINTRGQVYGGGVRYPQTHQNQGEWLCYHAQPGGQGGIDFCVQP